MKDVDMGSYIRSIVLIPIFTATISLVSSLYLIYRIVRNIHKSKAQTRDRLLLGLCVFDCCGSLGFAFSTFPGPELLRGPYPTTGNVATCTAQGFLVQLGVGVPLYNAALCLYYVLAICYRVQERHLKKYFVSLTHFIIVTSILSSAMVGLRLDLFNFAGAMGWWISSTGGSCLDSFPEEYCARGERASEFEMYFGLAPVALSFAVVFISMAVLYFSVRTTEQRARRWDPSRVEASSDSMASATVALPSRQRQRQTLSQQTMERGLFYSTNFIVVYLPAVLLATVARSDGNQQLYRSVSILNVIFLPLQGFLNLLVYTINEWRERIKQNAQRLPQLRQASHGFSVKESPSAPLSPTTDDTESRQASYPTVSPGDTSSLKWPPESSHMSLPSADLEPNADSGD